MIQANSQPPTPNSKLPTTNSNEIGYVVSNRDFLARLDGFPSIQINDLVVSDNGLRGWVNALANSDIEVLMLDEGKISPKQTFKRLAGALGVPIGDFLIGRAINPLGVPIDGKGPLTRQAQLKTAGLEQAAPGIENRQIISRQFQTGVTIIDSIIPLGYGQRELVLGDAHSGKTSFLIDLIINQKNTGTICIYAAIGKPAVSIRNLIDLFRANQALKYTVVVATASSEMVPLIFLTPKTALTIAEYFQKQGKDVLVILDDMGIHAKAYREMSLLGEKAPGRESYPGDMFYQHAHLLERAGNFLPSYGGGSITAIPVIELNLTDFTTLIPTNLMSMTDGHLLFRSNLHSQGQRPAIDISLSVSRVGRQTQDKVSNLISQRVRQILSSAEDLETLSRFSTELSPQTQLILKQKDLILEIIKQDLLTIIPKPIQVIMLALPFTTFLQTKSKIFVAKYKNTLIQAFLKDPQFLRVTKAFSSFKDDNDLIKTLEAMTPALEKLCPS